MAEHQLLKPLPAGQLVEGLSFDRYRQVDAINASGLKTVLRSPAHYWHEKHFGRTHDTPAQRFGHLLHAAVLEPERFAEDVVTRPDHDSRSKAGREARDAWVAEQRPGAIILSQDERDRIEALLTAVRGHKRLTRLLNSGSREVSLFWDDDEFEVPCKARFDFVARDTNIIVDIKTTMDGRPDPFGRDMVKYQYGLSAAHYLAGAKQTGVADGQRFVLVAIEKEPPFGIALYEVAPEELDRSRAWRRHAMAAYARCMRDQFWPCYPETFSTLEAPPWAPLAPPCIGLMA